MLFIFLYLKDEKKSMKISRCHALKSERTNQEMSEQILLRLIRIFVCTRLEYGT